MTTGVRCPMSNQDTVKVLRSALERILDYQYRSDRRQRGMVDVEEVLSLQRMACVALRTAGQR